MKNFVNESENIAIEKVRKNNFTLIFNKLAVYG